MLITPTQIVTLPGPDVGTIIDESLDEALDHELEPMWRVILHNDNVTPMEYVMIILETIFFLSGELSEHVMWTAHTKGWAVVVIRPREEAERLADIAQTRSRLDGFPLKFTTEPDD